MQHTTKLLSLKARNLLRSLLCLMLILSLAFSLVGCGSSSSSKNPTVTPDDEEETVFVEDEPAVALANGNFNDDDDDSAYPMTSVSSWTKAGDSIYGGTPATDTASTYTRSGIIDVKKLRDKERADQGEVSWTGKGLDISEIDTNLFFKEVGGKPIVPNPDLPQEVKVQNKADYELALAKAKYHGYDEKEDYFTPVEEADQEYYDSNVLMLANKIITSQKFTSQSVTIPTDSFVKVSVWVKAFGLDFVTEAEAAADTTLTKGNIQGMAPFGNSASNGKNLGANVRLIGTDVPLIVKGIDTTKDNGDGTYSAEWKQYSFYISGHSSLSTSVTVELGLGFGDNNNTNEFCKGFAFFDNVKVDFITPAEFSSIVSSLPASAVYSDLSVADRNSGKMSREYYYDLADGNTGATTFAYNYNNSADLKIADTNHNGSYKLVDGAPIKAKTSLEWLSKVYADNADFGIKHEVFNDVSEALAYEDGLFTKSDIYKHTYNLNSKLFANKLGETDDVKGKDKTSVYALDDFIFSADTPLGYVSNYTKTSAGVKVAENMTFEADKYYQISLYVKTSNPSTSSIKLYLRNKDNTRLSGLTSVNSTSNYVNPDKQFTAENLSSKYYGWQRYTFYFSTGKSYDKMSPDNIFDLELWLGDCVENTLTRDQALTVNSYAFYTPVYTRELNYESYAGAVSSTSSSTGNTLDLGASYSVANGYFNTYASIEDEDKIVDYGIPANFTKITNDKSFTYDAFDVKSGIKELPGGNKVLEIDSASATGGDAIGYRSASLTLSANIQYVISVWVKTDSVAKVNLYLVDSDGKVVKTDGDRADKDKDGKVVNIYPIAEEDKTTLEITNINTSGKWQRQSFGINVGDSALNVSLEMWVGSKDGEVLSGGVAQFDYVEMFSSSSSKTFIEDFEENVERFTELYNDFTPTEVTTAAEFKKADFTIVYNDTELADEEIPSDSDVDTSETIESGEFPWASVSSLIVAAALVIALIAVIVKKLKITKKVKIENAEYDRDNGNAD